MMKLDIKVVGNTISGRQGWAYICNSMKFAVLKADMEKKQEYTDFAQFGKVRVIWNYKGRENGAVGTLECEKGKWFIGGNGAMLKGSFGFSDMMESIEQSNYPIIRKDDIVAVALFSQDIEFASLNLFRVGKIDVGCMTMTHLTPLTDEEMQTVKRDAEMWCNR